MKARCHVCHVCNAVQKQKVIIANKATCLYVWIHSVADAGHLWTPAHVLWHPSNSSVGWIDFDGCEKRNDNARMGRRWLRYCRARFKSPNIFAHNFAVIHNGYFALHTFQAFTVDVELGRWGESHFYCWVYFWILPPPKNMSHYLLHFIYFTHCQNNLQVRCGRGLVFIISKSPH